MQASAVRPSDAYLFVGSDRTKSEAARIFAAALLCPRSCGQCEICRRVLGGLHPDVQIFEPEGYTFPVELIRQIVMGAAQTPMEAARRVFILEEAHRIAERSQNALLKGLEEPGRSVTWILTTDTLEPLLPTVLSRCQIVEFPPLGEDAIRDLLHSRFGADHEEATGLARAAAGSLENAVKLATDPRAGRVRLAALEAATHPEKSPGWALSTADAITQIAAESKASAEKEHKRELAGFDESIGKGKGSAGSRKKLADRHKRALRRSETEVYLDFLFWLGSAYRDLAAAACGAPPEALVFREELAALPHESFRPPVGFCLKMAQACAEAQLAIRENANAALAVESTLLSSVTGS